MSDIEVQVYDVASDNTLTVEVVRRLNESESEALRQLLESAFNLGYDNCRDERDRQEKNPNYPLHRRNPWSKDAQCTQWCCVKSETGQS